MNVVALGRNASIRFLEVAMLTVGMVRGLLAGCVVALLSLQSPAMAQMSHEHGSERACAEATLRCASKVTPTFAPDGTLWLAWAAGGKVSVARSPDLGRTFTAAVSVNPEPLALDWGPDARPKIAIDRDGRVFVAFAIFKDKAFNGHVLYTHSFDEAVHSRRPFQSRQIRKVSASRRSRSIPADRCSRRGSTSVIECPRKQGTKPTSVPR